MTDLEKARNKINEVDEKMAKLFAERMDAVKEVAVYKKEKGLPIVNASREEEVITKNTAIIENPEYRTFYKNFIRYNMELSKNYQRQLIQDMKVAFSGVKGAFAEIASKRIFPDAEIIPYSDFSSAYKAVENGEAECVLLPLENSFNGDVGQVMDLAFFGSLYINGIYDIEIVQNLLGVKGTTVNKIKTVISHPQALGQCASYIEQHGFNTEESANTAIAAKQVAESGREDLGAIGSKEAAEDFGLSVIDSHINQSNLNTTRFAVFSPSPKNPDAKDDRFILLFTVKNVAGALGKAITIIGAYGFNLRALKSRPTKELVWDYYFYAEGEGKIHSANGEAMLNQLKNCCDNLRILACYEKEIKL